MSSVSLVLQVDSSPVEPPGKPLFIHRDRRKSQLLRNVNRNNNCLLNSHVEISPLTSFENNP